MTSSMSIGNGVLEVIRVLENDAIIFQASSQNSSQNGTITSKIIYDDQYTWEHPGIVKTVQWLVDIFQARYLVHDFLHFLISCIKNDQRKLISWTGDVITRDYMVSICQAIFGKMLTSHCTVFTIPGCSQVY